MIDLLFHMFLLEKLRLSIGSTFLQHRQEFIVAFRVMTTEIFHATCHLHMALLIPLRTFVFGWIQRWRLQGWHKRLHSLLLLQQTIHRDTSTFQRLQRWRQFIADCMDCCFQRLAKDESRQFTGDIDIVEFTDLFLEIQRHLVLLLFQRTRTAVSRLEEKIDQSEETFTDLPREWQSSSRMSIDIEFHRLHRLTDGFGTCPSASHRDCPFSLPEEGEGSMRKWISTWLTRLFTNNISKRCWIKSRSLLPRSDVAIFPRQRFAVLFSIESPLSLTFVHQCSLHAFWKPLRAEFLVQFGQFGFVWW